MSSRIIIILITIFSISKDCFSENIFQYNIETNLSVGNGDFAPFWMISNNHGAYSSYVNSSMLRCGIEKLSNENKIFDYEFNIDLIGYSNNYNKIKVQQFNCGINFYNLNLNIGSKEYNSRFLNQKLSSGSLIWSGNSTPIPQIRISLADFISLPYTNDWIQIKGDISYGLFIDKNWKRKIYSYNNSYITTDDFFHQKSFFFRSNPDKKFVLIIGLETASQFGGNKSIYENGELINEEKYDVKLKDFFNVLIPVEGGSNSPLGDQAYIYGNHIGSWHINSQFKFNKCKINLYTEWIFEDGSGIGKLNGWDGLWGGELNLESKYLNSIILEYLNTRNQSGPIHWAPGDFNGTVINSQATGGDDYYNHYYYNSWSHFGEIMGSPIIKSPFYNNDGYLGITDNRIEMFHLGLCGNINNKLSYISKISYIESLGTYYIPAKIKRTQVVALLGLQYKIEKIKGLSLSLNGALDKGDLYGNNSMLSLSVKLNNSILKR